MTKRPLKDRLADAFREESYTLDRPTSKEPGERIIRFEGRAVACLLKNANKAEDSTSVYKIHVLFPLDAIDPDYDEIHYAISRRIGGAKSLDDGSILSRVTRYIRSEVEQIERMTESVKLIREDIQYVKAEQSQDALTNRVRMIERQKQEKRDNIRAWMRKGAH